MAHVETYQLSSGGKRYRVRWERPDGRAGSKSFPRKKDADRFKTEVESRIALGTLYEEKPLTFKEFYASWKERYRTRVRPSTYRRLLEVEAHLKPFEDTRLDRLTAGDVEDYISALARVAPRQAQLALQVLKMALRNAKERGQMVSDAVFKVKAPKLEAAEMMFLSWEQVEALAANTEEPYGNLIQLAALTGLRQGELFALTDDSLDLEAGTVLVERSIYQGESVPLKTSASRRRVDLSAHAVKLVRAQLLARIPNERGLLFPSPRGVVIDANNFRHRVFKAARDRTGLTGLRFHDLRHTYAALMVRAGAHPKYLQAQMGHASIKVTLDRYGHLLPDENRTVLTALDTLTQRHVAV